MKIHIDHPWAKCVREDGAPLRAYINLGKRGLWQFALWPGHGSQVYDRKTQTYTDRWSWLAYRPPLKEKEIESPKHKTLAQ